MRARVVPFSCFVAPILLVVIDDVAAAHAADVAARLDLPIDALTKKVVVTEPQ